MNQNFNENFSYGTAENAGNPFDNNITNTIEFLLREK